MTNEKPHNLVACHVEVRALEKEGLGSFVYLGSNGRECVERFRRDVRPASPPDSVTLNCPNLVVSDRKA